jgi:hypothetical protein
MRGSTGEESGVADATLIDGSGVAAALRQGLSDIAAGMPSV